VHPDDLDDPRLKHRLVMPGLVHRGQIDRGRLISDPGKWANAAFWSPHARGYLSRPQAHSGLRGRVFSSPRGMGPGGCTLINAMQYSRGYEGDYADWPHQDVWASPHICRYKRRGPHVECRTFLLDPAPGCLRSFERVEAKLGLQLSESLEQNELSGDFASACGAAGLPEDKSGPKGGPDYYVKPDSYAPMRSVRLLGHHMRILSDSRGGHVGQVHDWGGEAADDLRHLYQGPGTRGAGTPQVQVQCASNARHSQRAIQSGMSMTAAVSMAGMRRRGT
jgi:hypothetical protein